MSKIFGLKLTKLRKINGLTQQDLAHELQVSRQIIGHWENNYAEPTLEMLNNIADYFNVSTDYLLGREPDSNGNKNFKYTEKQERKII